jgi:hypothetical protein
MTRTPSCTPARLKGELEAFGTCPDDCRGAARTQSNALTLWSDSGSPQQCASGQEWFVRFGNASAHVDLLAVKGVPDHCEYVTAAKLFLDGPHVTDTPEWRRVRELDTAAATGLRRPRKEKHT